MNRNWYGVKLKISFRVMILFWAYKILFITLNKIIVKCQPRLKI